MKNIKTLKCLIAAAVILFITTMQSSFAQVVTKRLPDGSVVYSDGTIRLPNGEIKYPKNRQPDVTTYPGSTTKRFPGNGTRQPDGSIIYPDGRVRYPDGSVRYPDGTVKYPNAGNNDRRIPPGQAKKMYGKKSARDYAPGHNKDRGYKKDDDNEDNDNRDYDDDHYKEKKEKGHKKGKNKHD